METFAWRVQAGMTKEVSYRIGENEFGDGYTQTYSLGINPRKRTWNITVLEDIEALEIEKFLDAHFGVLPFLWTPPLYSAPITVKCKGYNTTNLGLTAHSMTMVFEEAQLP